MYDSGNKTVDTLGKLNLEGNVIPNSWYQTLKKENGKPDINAMILLSDFVYWYRPTIERDEETGLVQAVKKKFKSDLLQRSYKQIEEQFGLTMKQAKETLVRLENKNVIKRVFRTVDTPQGRLPNIMFIELNVKGLIEVTYPKRTDVCTKKDGYPSKKGRTTVQERTDITEITTEITTDIKEEEERVRESANPFFFFEENGFGAISSYMSEKINAWCLDLSDELVVEAMKLAVENGSKTWRYVEAILRDWVDKGYQTVEAVHAARKAYQDQQLKKRQTSKQGHRKATRQELVPDWLNTGQDHQNKPPEDTSFEDEKRRLQDELQKYKKQNE